MERLLVASDLYERSRRALRRALSLGKQFDADLTILYVADNDRPEGLVEEECQRSEEALADLVVELGGEQFEPAPLIVAREGDPFQIIAEEADAVDADLIVMGSHRKRLLKDVFTGTTIERVMRSTGRPVLMVNQDGEEPYQRDLLGLMASGSTGVVHGFMPLGEGLMNYAGIERSKIDEHVSFSANQARDALDAFLRERELHQASQVIFLEKGTPFEAVKSGVDAVQPDLLVIGTRGHSGLKKIFLGSVADQVLRQIECDILAVPPKNALDERE